MKPNPSFYITGYHGSRQLTIDKAKTDHASDPKYLVSIPCGFEPMQVVVIGCGLSAEDCLDAAAEFLSKRGWFTDDSQEEHLMDNAYVQPFRF